MSLTHALALTLLFAGPPGREGPAAPDPETARVELERVRDRDLCRSERSIQLQLLEDRRDRTLRWVIGLSVLSGLAGTSGMIAHPIWYSQNCGNSEFTCDPPVPYVLHPWNIGLSVGSLAVGGVAGLLMLIRFRNLNARLDRLGRIRPGTLEIRF